MHFAVFVRWIHQANIFCYQSKIGSIFFDVQPDRNIRCPYKNIHIIASNNCVHKRNLLVELHLEHILILLW